MNAIRRPTGLAPSFALVILAYVLAFGTAIGVVHFLTNRPLIFVTLVADIAATCVIYIFGRVFHNSSFYDPYWSIAPIAIAIYWTLSSNATVGALSIVVLLLVSAWGLRLTWNWARGWRGLGDEDWRYTDLRNKTKGWFWLVELLGIDFMPTMVVFLGCLSLYPALTSQHSFSVLDVAAIAVTSGAILIETVSDNQLNRFRNARHEPGKIMASGLWAYSRHPNYFGEIMFWWGLYLFALAANARYWWTIIGPLAITSLFLCVSIPMMDKHLEERHA